MEGPTETEWAEFVAGQRSEMDAAGFSEARSRSLSTRMDRAAAELPDGASWYALRNIRERARSEASNVEANLRGFAEITGETYETVNSRYHQYLEEVDRGRSVTAPEGYESARDRWRRQGLPADHGTYTALTRISREAMETQAADTDRPHRVQPVEFPNSTAIATAGWDPHDGRLEVVFRRRGDNGATTSRVYAYRGVPESVWRDMRGEEGPGAVYNREIRNHSEYRYDSIEDEETGAHRRCGNCGQWWAPSHTCPVPAPGENVSTVPPSGRSRTPEENAATNAEVLRILDEIAATEADATSTTSPVSDSSVATPSPDTHDDEDDEAFMRCGDCGEFMDGSHSCTAASDSANLDAEDRSRAADLADQKYQASVAYLRDQLTETENAAPSEQTPEPTPVDEPVVPVEPEPAPEAEVEVVAEESARPEPRPARSLGIYSRTRRINSRRVPWGDPSRNDCASAPAVPALRAAAATGPVEFNINYYGRRNNLAGTAGELPHGWFDVSGTAVYDRPGRGQHNFSTRDMRCTCPDYQANYDCAHINYVTQRMREHVLPATGGAAAPLDVAAAQRAAEEAMRQDWMRNESHAEEARARHAAASDPQDSYTNNFAAFEADHDAALARKARGEEAVPMMTENVFNGEFTRESGRGFGVEMEFDFPQTMDSSARSVALREIGAELYAAGLTPTAYQEGYHSSARRGYTDNHAQGWSFERDCTVSGEIVSPVMYDEPETWQNIDKVCEIVRRHGGIANAKTGSHVHVGAPNMTTETASELIRMTNQHEDVMYRISQNPERNAHRPMSWCGPNTDVPQGGYGHVSSLRSVGSTHRYGMNLAGVRGGDSDHPEVRYWDGTLNASVIQAQIKVSAGLVQAAERNGSLGQSRRNREPVGSHQRRLLAVRGRSRRALTTEELQEDTATVRSFMDTLFTRREDKAQVAALFAVTKWQTRR